MSKCENCTFEIKNIEDEYEIITDHIKWSYYCKECFPEVRKQKIRERNGVLPKEEVDKQKLIEEIEQLKNRSEVDHEEFQKALVKAEEWHKSQKAEIINKKDQEIKELKEEVDRLNKLVLNKEISSLQTRMERLEVLLNK